MSPHKPTDKQRGQVSAFVSYGLQHNEIAKQIGIDGKTLRKHYREELDTGKLVASAKVAQTLFSIATVDRNVGACIFWLKAQAGWSERAVVEHSGPGGGPIEVDSRSCRFDFDRMSPKALTELLEAEVEEAKSLEEASEVEA